MLNELHINIKSGAHLGGANLKWRFGYPHSAWEETEGELGRLCPGGINLRILNADKTVFRVAVSYRKCYMAQDPTGTASIIIATRYFRNLVVEDTPYHVC